MERIPGVKRVVGVVLAVLIFQGVVIWFSGGVLAQESSPEEKIKRLEERIRILEEEEKKEHEEKEKREREAKAPLTGSGKLIFARPFYTAPKAIVGGYMDLEFFDFGRDGTNSGKSTFDQHRFVPFFYADITERVKVATELEFEHGGRSGDKEKSEVDLEFAFIEYQIAEPINFRAGIILDPLGKFNLIHDSPLNDLTDRPLVNRFIIPAVLREPGVGFYGTFYPTELSKLDYELYLVNGFNGFDKDKKPRITAADGLRNARWPTSQVGDRFDNNNNKAILGRLVFSPLLGIELGGSIHLGDFDPDGKRELAIWAIDGTIQRGPFELVGEAAWADLDGNNIDLSTGAPTTNPERMFGYYAQVNYHFLPDLLKGLAPAHFTDASTFTLVVRWDDVNTDRDREGGPGDLQRLSPGLNFRPTEDTVFKFEYQINFEDGNQKTKRNDGVLFSVATYF